MKLMDKLERKVGKYAIKNLMLYIILGNIAVYLLCMFNTNLVFYLYLNPDAVLSGQVWRLVTFFVYSALGQLYSILHRGDLSVFLLFYRKNAGESMGRVSLQRVLLHRGDLYDRGVPDLWCDRQYFLPE